MAKKKKKQVLVSDHDDSTSPNQEQGLAEEALEELERALADLGNARRENLPIGGDRQYVNVDALEQSKRAYQKGTAEYALHQRDNNRLLTITNAWKTALVNPNDPNVNVQDNVTGIGTGNSHRARMVANLQGGPSQAHRRPEGGRMVIGQGDARKMAALPIGPSRAQPKRSVNLQAASNTKGQNTQGGPQNVSGAKQSSTIASHGGSRQKKRQYHQTPLHSPGALSFEDDRPIESLSFAGVQMGGGVPLLYRPIAFASAPFPALADELPPAFAFKKKEDYVPPTHPPPKFEASKLTAGNHFIEAASRAYGLSQSKYADVESPAQALSARVPVVPKPTVRLPPAEATPTVKLESGRNVKVSSDKAKSVEVSSATAEDVQVHLGKAKDVESPALEPRTPVVQAGPTSQMIDLLGDIDPFEDQARMRELIPKEQLLIDLEDSNATEDSKSNATDLIGLTMEPEHGSPRQPSSSKANSSRHSMPEEGPSSRPASPTRPIALGEMLTNPLRTARENSAVERARRAPIKPGTDIRAEMRRRFGSGSGSGSSKQD